MVKPSTLSNYIRNIINNSELPICINYEDHPKLSTTNGQSWNRRGSILTIEYYIFAVNNKKDINPNNFRYANYTDTHQKIVEKLIQPLELRKGNNVRALIIISPRKEKDNTRLGFSQKDKENIRIRDNNECIVCGSKTELNIDHKDDSYQSIELTSDDGQLLCSSCNTKKRAGNSNKRSTRKCPPYLSGLRKEFCMDSYNFWFDPRGWINKILKKKERCDRDYSLLQKENISLIRELKDLKLENKKLKAYVKIKNDI
jgi:hypothetical protein